jgi:hypothetical protein
MYSLKLAFFAVPIIIRSASTFSLELPQELAMIKMINPAKTPTPLSVAIRFVVHRFFTMILSMFSDITAYFIFTL